MMSFVSGHPIYCCKFAPAGVRAAAKLQLQPRRPPFGQFSRDPPWNYHQEPVTGGSFDLTTVVPIVYPRKIGSLAKFDLPKYLRG